ncbi:MAG: NDP-sugar synthase [Candidatus Thermoplasmatota archaeon]
MSEAVILAGGTGKRLKPLTEQRPKPLIPVAGRPCIDYVLRSLVGAGIKEVIITTSYLSERVIKRIGDGAEYGANILYSFEEMPMGTAGAVKKVEGFLSDPFVVASGDVFADVNVANFLDFHAAKGSDFTLALTKVNDPSEFGIVELDRESRVVRFVEKPRREEVFSKLINAGIYVISRRVLDKIPAGVNIDFSKDIIPMLLGNAFSLYGRVIEGHWHDIGRPQDLLMASLAVVEKEGEKLKLDGVRSRGPIILGKGAALERGVRIIGPAYIGADVYISRGTVIDRSCIYDKVFIDRGAVIKESTILEGSKVGWQSEVEGSVIGQCCTIEEDVRLKNSVLGDNIHIKIHSRLEDANISPPPLNGGAQ